MMELKELCRAIADDAKLEIAHYPEHPFRGATNTEALKHFLDVGSDRVRLAPTLKPVDMSVLIDSGIDCEFFCSGDMEGTILAIGRVTGVDESGSRIMFRSHLGDSADRCRPRQDYWHSLLNCKANVDGRIIDNLRAAGFAVIPSNDSSSIRISICADRCYPWEAV